MPSTTNYDPHVDEETALLASQKRLPTPTPLEWSQVSIVLLLQLCEPLTSHSIYPYINQLISELDITGGDERKVGYYAGLMGSLFFATEAMTVLQWSRLSDHIGRKPVLLTGLMGLAVSILCFGFSRTFWGLIASRCLSGMLNGNIGVMKSVLGELTDSTNRADAFSLMPVVWGGGATLGPLIGGTLSNPHERFPNVFGGTFWEKYPYLLPAAAVAGLVFVSYIIVLAFFKETVQVKTPIKSIHSGPENTSGIRGDIAPPLHPQPAREGPVPLRELLVYRILISIANYLVLAFLDMGITCLQPLFFAMPIEIGGLGLSPPTIGYILGSLGAASGLFQVFFFARSIKRFGLKRVFLAGIFAFIPMFCLFPIMSIVAQGWGMSPLIWMMMAAQVALAIVMRAAYGCVFMYITSAAPNKRSLGSTNGLAQTTVSMARAFGPAVSTSLFSFSVEYNILGGYGVYAFLSLLSGLAVVLAAQLPEGEWRIEAENRQ